MKSSAHRLIFLTLLIALCAVVPASAQKLQIDHLDTLFPKAAETVDVTIDESLIKLAAKFLSSSKPDEAAIKSIVSALKGVYVKGVEFDKEGEYSEADIEKVRSQLRAPSWERIVGVRSKREGDNAEVYLMMQNDVIMGVGVIVFSRIGGFEVDFELTWRAFVAERLPRDAERIESLERGLHEQVLEMRVVEQVGERGRRRERSESAEIP